MMLAPLGPAVAEALRIGIGFLWTAAWAIIMGLVITSLVQVYVSRKNEWLPCLAMPIWPVSRRPRCSALPAAAVASVRSPSGRGSQKGAHVVNFLAFMFASTNLIVELGLMILILLGWEFLVAELLGGLILIAVMAVIVQLTLPETLFEEVRTELNQRITTTA